MPSEHYESLYHCVNCRRVYYFEGTEDKITWRCEDCGPSTMFKISVDELVGERAVPQEGES